MKTILLFILLLSLIIIVHECGHLIAAKIFGVYCAEFSIGMGPKLFTIKGKETNFVLKLLPIGGSVAMAGDANNALETNADPDNQIPKERTLNGIAYWKRIVIMLAGIFMNFVLAIIIVAIILMINGSYAISPDSSLGKVNSGYPAYEAGLKEGDVVTKVEFENGSKTSIKNWNDFSDFMLTYDGNGPVTITIKRDGEKMTYEVMPVYDEESQSYIIGVSSSDYDIVDINFFNSFYYALFYIREVVKLMFTTIIGLFKGIGLENLSGPIGIYNVTSQAASMGAMTYLNLIALLSINVGLINALPLPILDGGRVLLVIIEMIIGHPISKKVENIIMTVSVALLLLLLVFATYQDIVKYIVK